MVDITIKDVPSGAETNVKEMAMIAIERFLRQKDVVVPAETISNFEKDVDTIREANTLTKKFEVPEKEEQIDEKI